jgi:hypothetical protein
MRVPVMLALCLATTLSLPAAGQSTPPAAAGQSAQPRDSSAPPAAQNATKASTASIQAATQPESPAQSAPTQKPETQKAQSQRNWPQAPFDRGIYAGRNTLTGNPVCLAIQSYNFSQGESPKLESVTTCTTLRQPLMRNARKPANTDQQGPVGQQEQNNKDKK